MAVGKTDAGGGEIDMEISPMAGPAVAGLVILAAFLVLYLWDKLTPPGHAGRPPR